MTYCPKCGKPSFEKGSDRFWKCSRVECGFKVTHHKPDCDICQKGQIMLEDLRARRAKEISFVEHQRRVKILGDAFCFKCEYNGITGRKAWAIRKLTKEFGAWDLFVEIE